MIRLASPVISDDACAAAIEVLRSGQLIHGAVGRSFEDALASFFGTSHVIVVSSGTAALHLALLGLGVGRGDAVLVPDFTFPATANVVELVGARPIFVDVHDRTYNMTPESVEAVINGWNGPERLAAIMPVHEFGCPAEINALKTIAARHGLRMIEDAACAIGTSVGPEHVGTFGNAGCFSFHPRKTLTTGEGGAIISHDAELAGRLRELRNHGIQPVGGKLDFVAAGLNYRLTDFQSAIGKAQLPHVKAWVEHRRRIAAYYLRELEGADVTLPEPVMGHAWQTFMVVLPDRLDRDEVIGLMKERGIETNLGAQALHALKYFAEKYPADAARLRESAASRLYQKGLALPIHQGMSDADAEEVVRSLRECVESSS
jgi:dTDP-4-amino-4,6-dideoxygalactose transaminase